MLNYRIIRFSTLVLAGIAGPLCNASQIASYAPPPFSHFEPILQRMPFGELPDKFGQAVDPATDKQDALLKAQQEILARKINMSAVNITPEGSTAIGFTDLSVTPPVNYYLLVGSESGGWKVNSANYDEETAEIEKDGVVIALQLGKGLVPNPAPAAPPATASASKIALTSLRTRSPVMAKPTPLSPAAANAATASAAAIRDQLRKVPAPQTSSGGLSYIERFHERKNAQSKALENAQTTQRQQLEKLARDVASKEIAKQAVKAEAEALEKELLAEEDRLQKEAETEAEKEQPAL